MRPAWRLAKAAAWLLRRRKIKASPVRGLGGNNTKIKYELRVHDVVNN
jgi:hypothetical protein